MINGLFFYPHKLANEAKHCPLPDFSDFSSRCAAISTLSLKTVEDTSFVTSQTSIMATSTKSTSNIPTVLTEKSVKSEKYEITKMPRKRKTFQEYHHHHSDAGDAGDAGDSINSNSTVLLLTTVKDVQKLEETDKSKKKRCSTTTTSKKAAKQKPITLGMTAVNRFVQYLQKFKDEKNYDVSNANTNANTTANITINTNSYPMINPKIESCSIAESGTHVLLKFAAKIDDAKNHHQQQQYSVKILERKRLLASDEEEQDTYFWIMLHGSKAKDSGYLHDKTFDLLAQEISGGYVLLNREIFKTYLYERLPCDGSTTATPKEAIYKIFRVGLRRETKTLVPAEDILDSDRCSAVVMAIYFATN